MSVQPPEPPPGAKDAKPKGWVAAGKPPAPGAPGPESFPTPVVPAPGMPGGAPAVGSYTPEQLLKLGPTGTLPQPPAEKPGPTGTAAGDVAAMGKEAALAKVAKLKEAAAGAAGAKGAVPGEGTVKGAIPEEASTKTSRNAKGGAAGAPGEGDGDDGDDTPVFLPDGAMPLDGTELVEFPLFADVDAKKIDSLIERHKKRRSQPPVWLRTFKRGDVIVREGEYGSTAFFIVKGKVEVRVQPPRGREVSPKDKAKTGMFGRFAAMLSGGSPTTRERAVAKEKAQAAAGPKKEQRDLRKTQVIPIDASIQLSYDRPFGELKEGDLFGEQSCLFSYPRSSTCVATEDVEVLELLRTALEFVRKESKRFKESVERGYRERAFESQLRAVPLFSNVSRDFVDFARDKVEFIEFKKDDVICREGDAADAFYLIRIGMVKVTQQRPGGELVLRYLGPGNYFGEVGILLDTPRRATCTALGVCELVKFKKADFDALMKLQPDVAVQLRAQAQAIIAKPKAAVEETIAAARLDEYLTQGLMTAQNILLIDLDRCTRCDDCVHACADAHDGVSRLIRDGMRFDKYLIPTSCRACQDPLCMIGCPVSSIRRRDSLEIVIEDWCIGCGKCAEGCPYGSITMHKYTEIAEEEGKPGKLVEQVVNKGKGKAVTCDLSAELHEPACTYACPHGAAIRVKPAEFFASKLTQDSRLSDSTISSFARATSVLPTAPMPLPGAKGPGQGPGAAV